MLLRLADRCFRHRRLVVLAGVAVLLGAFALAGAFGRRRRCRSAP